MTSRQYVAIDESVGTEIKRPHKHHQKLGHDGLLDALRQQDIHVDPEELERYMKRNRMEAERYWRPWKWVGLPRWMYTGAIHYRSTRRWRLWRK